MKFNKHPMSESLLSGLTKLKWSSTAVLMTLSGGFTTTALAQSERPQMGLLEEVVVTARRRDESMQDVPIAVTALSDEFLQENNITSTEDLRTHIPSLGIGSVGQSTNTPQVSLRGLRPDDVLLSLDPAVPLYFADVVMTPTHGTNQAMYDLAQVQILKGPQGTLFGRNSTGGAILLQPKAPGYELGGYMNVKAGNYNMYRVEGAVDLPVNDRAQVRLAGFTTERDGYQENVADNALNGEEFWDQDSFGVRVSLSVQLTDHLDNALVVSYDESDNAARVGEPLAYNPGSSLGSIVTPIHNLTGAVDQALAEQAARDWQEIATDIDAREKLENTLVSNTTTWDLANGMTVKNIVGYRKLDFSFANDTDGTALPLFGASAEPGASVTFDPAVRAIESEQWSNELQLFGTSLDNRVEWLVGAYWYDMEGEESAPVMVVGANPAVASFLPPSLAPIAANGFYQNSPQGDVHNESTALFAEATYAVSDRLNLTLGARQSWDERSVTVRNTQRGQCQVTGPGGVALPNCEREVNEDFSAPTWRVVVDYSLDDASMVYGSVATGYRSGGFNLRGTNDIDLEPFEEETVLTYELGHKADWTIGSVASLRTNLAVYFSDYEDIQRTQDVEGPGGALITRTVNAAKAEIKGAELDVLFTPTQNLELKAAWSYVDAEYVEWERPVPDGVDADSDPDIIDVSGAPFIWIPEHSATGSIKYYLPLDASLGEVSLMGSIYWQDEVVTDDTVSRLDIVDYPSDAVAADFLATEVVDSYSVINLRADWRYIMGSNVDLALFVNNLEDEEYATGGLTVEDSQGWSSRVYGPPRTYGAALNWRF